MCFWKETVPRSMGWIQPQDCAKPDIKISNAEGAGEITFKGANSAGN